MTPTNKIFTAFGLVFAMTITGACASSPESTPTSYGTSAAIEGDPDRMVCRRVKETGSRLSSRTCKTAREWEEERLANQEEMRNAQRGGAVRGDMPSAGGG